LKVCYLQDRKY